MSQLTLYELACEKAAFVGSWFVSPVHVRAAIYESDEEGLAGEASVEWENEIENAIRHVSQAKCIRLRASWGSSLVSAM
jgi:hypothetical protein